LWLESYLWLLFRISAIPNTVKGSEFVQKIQRLGRERNISVQLVTAREKDSHATLYFGARFIIVKDHKKEIGPGLLQKMLSDFGLDKADIR
jgi:mRNA interferase HicA